MTETCIMSQLDCRAGTRAEARWSSGGSSKVAPATAPSAAGAVTTPTTATRSRPER